MARYGCDLEEDDHENLSRALAGMLLQARGVRGLVVKAGGRRTKAYQAATAVVESVGHLQEILLAEYDRVYGSAPDALTRTRYRGGRS